VGPSEEDVDILRRLSQKFLNPPLVIDDNFKVVTSKVPLDTPLMNAKVETMDDVPDSPSIKRNKSKRVEKVTDQEEIESFKRSVLCDDDEDSNEERRSNLKRKRECIDFGPCANPPFKSRKTYSSKASTKPTKNILATSKILDKNLAKSVPKPPYSLPLGVEVVSNGLSELIEGDYFTDNEVNKTIVTYIPDVFKCPDGYMSSQTYKEVIKMPGWSIPLAILCAIVFTIIINSYCPMLISMFCYLKKILSDTVDMPKAWRKFKTIKSMG
jgi:hypothetical protein